jgi:hypothetical protein
MEGWRHFSMTLTPMTKVPMTTVFMTDRIPPEKLYV